MKISEIKNNEGSINIEADVVEVGEVREINKYGKNLKVANVIIMDSSGKVKLTLWNEEISKVKKGDRIKITNGYAKAFQDELQLTLGKFGKLEVVGKAQESGSEDGEEDVEVAASEEKVSASAVKTNKFEDDEEEDAPEDEEW